VTAFTAETMHEAPRFFVRKAAGFAAALADYGPPLHFEFARHRICGQGCPRSIIFSLVIETAGKDARFVISSLVIDDNAGKARAPIIFL